MDRESALSKGERTRIRIIEAATDLFFKQGFYQITLSQIAGTVGLTQQAIYRYFDSMDDIIVAACLHWVKEAQGYIDTGALELKSAKEQLRLMVEANFAYSMKNRKKDALLLGLYYHALGSTEVMRVYQKIKNDGVHRIHVLIAQGNREKCWSVKDPHAKAFTIHSLLVGEIVKMIIEPTEKTLESRTQRTFQEIMLLLNATPAV